MPRPGEPVWPDAAAGELARLWAEGLTAKAIAERLAAAYPEHGFSRDAVVGKAYRMRRRSDGRGCAGRPSPIRRQRDVRRRVREIADAGGGLARQLAVMPANACRFPVPHGGGERFCAARTVEGTAYCAAHLARVHAAPKPDGGAG